ncbi:MAG: DUF494 family protein [Bacillota bacterium]
MNKNIVEILSVLIQKMIQDKDLSKQREEITVELEDKGYTIEDINEAFDIVFEEVIELEENDFYNDLEMTSGYNRVFTDIEKFYFNKETKTIIYKLNNLAVLKAEELESIIQQMMYMGIGHDLEADLIWEIINEEVDSTEVMLKIATEIEEFKGNFLKQEVVN